jgi:hypothetical protein
MNDSGGILGVIVGAVLVLGILYFAFGDRLGIRTTGGGSTTVNVEAPSAPTPSK